MEPLGVDAFRGVVERVADLLKIIRGGFAPTPPPRDLIADMLAAHELPLPRLLKVVGAPFVAQDGSIVAQPGYHAAVQVYLDPDPKLVIPPVMDSPDAGHVDAAKGWLLEHLLGDFPFSEQSDRANALAALLLPFVRLLIAGPTPLHLVEASVPGTGKGLLVDALTIPADGRGPSVLGEARHEEEWRKTITAVLLQAPTAVMIDNVAGPLQSPSLSAVLTSQIWEDRILGYSKMAALPVTCTWFATANNPLVSTEIARRSVPIRLDAVLERPWERANFRYPDLRSWAASNRGSLIWSALTIVRVWVAAGMPGGSAAIGSYERWAQIVGGILDVAGVPGFLGNRERLYSEADFETAAWALLVGVWWDGNGPQPVTAGQLVDLAAQSGLLPSLGLNLGFDFGPNIAANFGIHLAQMLGRVIAVLRICDAGGDSHLKVRTYRLEDLRSKSGAAG